jgi:spore coat polysaccharide biosynthesis predicted glycosyltransferase SpsG
MVVMRCDGSAALGMGHVSRCLALAEELRGAHRLDVTFAMRDPDSVGVAAVRAQGYRLEGVPAEADIAADEWLRACVASREARALVVDVSDQLSRAALESARAAGILVVTIDDASDRRLASDLAFYPPVPQVEEMDWRAFAGKRFVGWEWVILKRDFAPEAPAPDGSGGSGVAGESGRSGLAQGATRAIDVLLTMGASDPAGMTEFALGALNLLSMPLAVAVVVGPVFSRAMELIDAAARSAHAVQIIRAPASMARWMRASRIAVASFGVSAYELAACGVPAVHLCLTADHARSSSAFDRQGMALTAGIIDCVTPTQVADAVARLMGHAGLRAEMAARARQLVDGRGAKRVAAAIVAALR